MDEIAELLSELAASAAGDDDFDPQAKYGLSKEQYQETIEEAGRLMEVTVEETVKAFAATAVAAMKLDPHQKGRVPDGYVVEVKCQGVRQALRDTYLHLLEEVYEVSIDEAWFQK